MSTRISYRELACLLFVVSMLLLVLLPACNSMPEDHKMLCQQNLKNIGAALKMYAEENEGMYPPLMARQCGSKNFNTSSMMFDVPLIYPNYMKDFSLLVCPDDAELFVDDWINPDTQKMDTCLVKNTSFAYMAWSVDEATFNKLDGSISAPYTEALKKLLQSDDIRQWEQDLVYIDKQKEAIHIPRTNTRLWKDSASYAAKVPIIFDLVARGMGLIMFNHAPGGSNVLYADGHVEFVRYCPPDCSPFPVDDPMADFLYELRMKSKML